MMQNNKPGMDPEVVMATLNQVTQTIEVLTSVVARLQKYVQAHVPQPAAAEQTIPAEDVVASSKKLLH
jgi:hypothetical protein